MLSDHGQTQGATFKQRNGYGLDELVERSLAGAEVTEYAGGDEQTAMVGHALSEATGRDPEKRPKNDVSDREAVVLGSGNLGLVYLMEEPRRLTMEEIDERHPELLDGARDHIRTSAGCWSARPSAGRSSSAPSGELRLADGTVEGDDPLGDLLADRRRSTCCAPTASSTSPTSWSAASTTPSSTRAARSRS